MTVIVCPPFLCLYTGFEKFLDCAVNLQFSPTSNSRKNNLCPPNLRLEPERRHQK